MGVLPMELDVFGIDRPCVDFTLDLNNLPRRNHGCLLNAIGWQGGGKVATGVVAAARLGARCAITGQVGDDLYGRFCREDFIRHGVDVSGLSLAPGCTTDLGVVVSERSSATRTILYRPGSVPPLEAESVDFSRLREARFLYIAQVTGLSAVAVDYARQWDVPVFIDADMYTPALGERLDEITYFVASEFVFQALFPDLTDQPLEALEGPCRQILSRGPRVVVFTFGSRGCVGVSEDEDFFVLPAFPVEVRDTVGAGDVFHGAFLAQLCRGKSVLECARYASATSAIKCTCPGGRAGIPTQEVLEQFVRTGVIDDTELRQRVTFYERGIEYVSS